MTKRTPASFLAAGDIGQAAGDSDGRPPLRHPAEPASAKGAGLPGGRRT